MESKQRHNPSSITKQQFMDKMLQYLGTIPFDIERFAIIVSDIVYDPELNEYIQKLSEKSEEGEIIDEIQVWSFLFDSSKIVFEEVFAAYYNAMYLCELIKVSEEDCNISSQIQDLFTQKTTIGKEITHRYAQQINQAFTQYPSPVARASVVAGAQKILVEELIKNA